MAHRDLREAKGVEKGRWCEDRKIVRERAGEGKANQLALSGLVESRCPLQANVVEIGKCRSVERRLPGCDTRNPLQKKRPPEERGETWILV